MGLDKIASYSQTTQLSSNSWVHHLSVLPFICFFTVDEPDHRQMDVLADNQFMNNLQLISFARKDSELSTINDIMRQQLAYQIWRIIYRHNFQSFARR